MEDLELDPPVLLLAGVGLVLGDGLLLPVARRLEPRRRDALRLEVLLHGVRALLRELLVEVGVPRVVGVARALDEEDLGVGLERARHRVEHREARSALDLVAPRFELDALEDLDLRRADLDE
jgi:hypothetical protein